MCSAAEQRSGGSLQLTGRTRRPHCAPTCCSDWRPARRLCCPPRRPRPTPWSNLGQVEARGWGRAPCLSRALCCATRCSPSGTGPGNSSGRKVSRPALKIPGVNTGLAGRELSNNEAKLQREGRGSNIRYKAGSRQQTIQC